MAWSTDFVDRLNAGGTFDFLWALEVLVVGSAPSAGTVVLGSAADIGDLRCIGLRGVRVQGGRLSMSSWTSTVGAFTVDVVGDPSTMFQYITRGSWVRVLCGFPGWVLADYQPVAIGRVYTIRGAPPLWTIECWDWKSALHSRNDPANPALFYNEGAVTTTVAAAFAPNSDTSITVSSTASFEKGSVGLIRVTGPTDAFYLTWTGTAAGPARFTGVSASNKFATLQEAVSTEVVTRCAYLTGLPHNVIRTVLTSTGAATNGSFDQLPSSWGYAIPDSLLDHDDMNRWRDEIVITATGSHTIDLHIDEQQEDGLAWLEGWMQPMGLFFTTRQGQITVRAVGANHFTGSLPGEPSEITDADIEPGEPIEWECWDSDYTEEWRYVTFASVLHNATEDTSVSTTEDTATLPAGEGKTISTATSVWDNTQGPLINDALVIRLDDTLRRIPERLAVSVPLRFAQLAPGDYVYVSSVRVYGREEADTGAYESRVAFVTEVSPDWMSGRCRLSLAIFPTSELAFA